MSSALGNEPGVDVAVSDPRDVADADSLSGPETSHFIDDLRGYGPGLTVIVARPRGPAQVCICGASGDAGRHCPRIRGGEAPRSSVEGLYRLTLETTFAALADREASGADVSRRSNTIRSPGREDGLRRVRSSVMGTMGK